MTLSYECHLDDAKCLGKGMKRHTLVFCYCKGNKMENGIGKKCQPQFIKVSHFIYLASIKCWHGKGECLSMQYITTSMSTSWNNKNISSAVDENIWNHLMHKCVQFQINWHPCCNIQIWNFTNHRCHPCSMFCVNIVYSDNQLQYIIGLFGCFSYSA